ncbi:hypothetical protein BC2230_110187 [Burkholderia cepacia]
MGWHGWAWLGNPVAGNARSLDVFHGATKPKKEQGDASGARNWSEEWDRSFAIDTDALPRRQRRRVWTHASGCAHSVRPVNS